MAETTLVALYDNELALDRVVEDLGRAGLGASVVSTLGPGTRDGGRNAGLVGVIGEALRGEGPEEATLEDAGVPRAEAEYLAEAVRRGAGALILRVGEADTVRARGLLEAQAPARIGAHPS